MTSKYSAKSLIVSIEVFSSTKMLQSTPQEVSILITTSSLFEVYLLSACEVKQKTEKSMIEEFFSSYISLRNAYSNKAFRYAPPFLWGWSQLGLSYVLRYVEAFVRKHKLFISIIQILLDVFLTKVSHPPLKRSLFPFTFVCLLPYPLSFNTWLIEVMQTAHILYPIFPTLQPLQGQSLNPGVSPSSSCT